MAWISQILTAAQQWAAVTNLNFALVLDNGSDIGSGNYQQGDPNMGDFRLSGYDFGNNVLAQTYLPPPINNYSIAGDMQFNTGQNFNIGGTYDLFAVAMHEIGHTLGLSHSTDISANMYPDYRGVKQGLAPDDVAGIQAIYSKGLPRSYDSVNGLNNSFVTSADVSFLMDPNRLTVTVTGRDITVPSQQSYYTIVAPVGTTGTMT